MYASANALVYRRATPDTLRCSGRFDLTREPIVLCVPETCGRYYALWLRDEAGKVFASIGARTTGTGRRTFVVLAPGQQALHLSPGLTPIVASSRTVRIAGVIEAVGTSDEAIAHITDAFRLVALSDLRTGRPIPAPIAGASGEEWPRTDYDPVADAIHAHARTDVQRRPLTGEHRYCVRFAPDAAPPVHGFWELTAGECSVGDRHPLALDPDGALTVHIQRTAPARSRMWNWLPAPPGPFSLDLHRYWPREEPWTPPPVTRLGSGPPAVVAGGWTTWR